MGENLINYSSSFLTVNLKRFFNILQNGRYITVTDFTDYDANRFLKMK